MRIRRARLNEGDALWALSLKSKQSNGYDDDFMALCREELRVTHRDLSTNEYWVAETEMLCGCVCLAVSDAVATGQVHSFFIHPDHQRKGIGRLLWRTVLNRAQTLNLDLLHLDADPNAVLFYEQLGFETKRQVPSGSIKGRMIPYMELRL